MVPSVFSSHTAVGHSTFFFVLNIEVATWRWRSFYDFKHHKPACIVSSSVVVVVEHCTLTTLNRRPADAIKYICGNGPVGTVVRVRMAAHYIQAGHARPQTPRG